MQSNNSNTVYQPLVQNLYQSVVQTGQKDGYARLPDSVLNSDDLTPVEKCVYAVIARGVHQGNTSRIGQRLIAKKLGVSKTTVNKSLAKLAEKGHLQAVGVGKSRKTYVLTSPVFGSKGRTGKTEIVSTPRGGRRHVGASPDARTA